MFNFAKAQYGNSLLKPLYTGAYSCELSHRFFFIFLKT